MKKFLALMLALVMVLSLAACGGKTEAPVETQAAAEAPAEAPAATTVTTETTVSVANGGNTLLSSDNVLNILLFGQDSPATEEDHGRSDTTILLSIDNVHKKLKLTSFQRDTYVSIPGHGENKINSAFTFGGESGNDESGTGAQVTSFDGGAVQGGDTGNMGGTVIDDDVGTHLF